MDIPIQNGEQWLDRLIADAQNDNRTEYEVEAAFREDMTDFAKTIEDDGDKELADQLRAFFLGEEPQ